MLHKISILASPDCGKPASISKVPIHVLSSAHDVANLRPHTRKYKFKAERGATKRSLRSVWPRQWVHYSLAQSGWLWNFKGLPATTTLLLCGESAALLLLWWWRRRRWRINVQRGVCVCARAFALIRVWTVHHRRCAHPTGCKWLTLLGLKLCFGQGAKWQTTRVCSCAGERGVMRKANQSTSENGQNALVFGFWIFYKPTVNGDAKHRRFSL